MSKKISEFIFKMPKELPTKRLKTDKYSALIINKCKPIFAKSVVTTDPNTCIDIMKKEVEQILVKAPDGRLVRYNYSELFTNELDEQFLNKLPIYTFQNKSRLKKITTIFNQSEILIDDQSYRKFFLDNNDEIQKIAEINGLSLFYKTMLDIVKDYNDNDSDKNVELVALDVDSDN